MLGYTKVEVQMKAVNRELKLGIAITGSETIEHNVEVLCHPANIVLLLGCCALGKESSRLALECFANRVMLPYILLGWYSHSGSSPGPALYESVGCQPLQRLCYRNDAHS